MTDRRPNHAAPDARPSADAETPPRSVPAEIVAAADAAVADVAAAGAAALARAAPSPAPDDSAPPITPALAPEAEAAARGLADEVTAMAVVLLAGAACLLVLLVETHDATIAAATGVAAAGVAWLYGVARRFARHGFLARAVLATTMGLVAVALLVGVALPDAIAVVLALPLIAVAIALPYSDARTLFVVMAVAWATEVLLAVGAELLVPATGLPPEVVGSLRVGGLVAGMALVMVFLWQFATRFGNALARMASGTMALRAAEERIGEVNEELRRRVAELEQRSNEAAQLTKMGDLLESCETSDEAYTVITQTAGPLFAGDSSVLYEIAANRTAVEQVAAWGENAASASVFSPSECWALRRGRPYVVEDATTELLCPHVGDAAPAAYLCIPLTAQSETLGLLHVEIGFRVPRAKRAAHLADRQRLAVTLSENLALALANFRLRATLRERSTRDELTGLYNRRYMEDSLDREIRRAIRDSQAVGVMLMDLDHFKRLNDAFGHAAGDFALRLVGELLQGGVRAEDIACRFGGEEFVVILPKASVEDTRRRAEALRLGIRALRPDHGGPTFQALTMSIGVAAYPEHGATGEGLLRAADEALYRAKAEGRDRVVVAGIREGTPLLVGPDDAPDRPAPADRDPDRDAGRDADRGRR